MTRYEQQDNQCICISCVFSTQTYCRCSKNWHHASPIRVWRKTKEGDRCIKDMNSHFVCPSITQCDGYEVRK